jgi:uroporphyrinogen decarboxylase
MNSRELAQQVLKGEKPSRPLFCPAIYEHKARLTGVSVSSLSTDSDQLAKACLAEWQTYAPDMMTVGIDIYNVEAEIIGAKVCLGEANDAVPHLEAPLITSLSGFEYPAVNDIYQRGRAKVFVDAAEKVNQQIGSEVMVRGSVSGPYSIAAALMGIEPAIMAAIMEPDQFTRLLDYCLDIAILYGREYAKRGMGICMFDSQAVPPLLSPASYEELVLPRVQKFVSEMKGAGAEMLEYVTGGDTTVIAAHLAATGFDIILSDFPSQVDAFIDAAKGKTVVRRNISPILIENGLDDELNKAVSEAVAVAENNGNVIIGTGVLSYNVKPENIIAVAEKVRGVRK